MVGGLIGPAALCRCVASTPISLPRLPRRQPHRQGALLESALRIWRRPLRIHARLNFELGWLAWPKANLLVQPRRR